MESEEMTSSEGSATPSSHCAFRSSLWMVLASISRDTRKRWRKCSEIRCVVDERTKAGLTVEVDVYEALNGDCRVPSLSWSRVRLSQGRQDHSVGLETSSSWTRDRLLHRTAINTASTVNTGATSSSNSGITSKKTSIVPVVF